MISAEVQAEMHACRKWLTEQPSNFTCHGLSKYEIYLLTLPICLWRAQVHKICPQNPTTYSLPLVDGIVGAMLDYWNPTSGPPALIPYRDPTENYSVPIGHLRRHCPAGNRRRVRALSSRDCDFQEHNRHYVQGARVYAFMTKNDDNTVQYAPLPPSLMLGYVDGSGRRIERDDVTLFESDVMFAVALTQLIETTDTARVKNTVVSNCDILLVFAQAKLYEHHASAQTWTAWLQLFWNRPSAHFTLNEGELEAYMQTTEPVLPYTNAFRRRVEDGSISRENFVDF